MQKKEAETRKEKQHKRKIIIIKEKYEKSEN
jgi:hypothetical protein